MGWAEVSGKGTYEQCLRKETAKDYSYRLNYLNEFNPKVMYGKIIIQAGPKY